jgi:hypothetical protein
MNETTSTQIVSAQQPPPSKYLWTADGWIRGIRKVETARRLHSDSSGDTMPSQEARA